MRVVASYIGSGFFSNGAQAEAIAEPSAFLVKGGQMRQLAPLCCINPNNFEILVEFDYNAVQYATSSQVCSA
jgi:hypothetical protein